MSQDKVIVYEDSAGEWRWHRRAAGNHELVSNSGEGYRSKDWAIEMATRLNPDAELEVHDPE
jgi:uncharacterized protein YegP (UPF0339 family)